MARINNKKERSAISTSAYGFADMEGHVSE